LMWLDLAPGHRFAHPTCTVLISESRVDVRPGSWRAVIDEDIRFPDESEALPDVVFPVRLGNALLHVLPAEIRPEDTLTDGVGGRMLPIQDRSLVMWLDLEPGGTFEHATRYIVIGAQIVEVVDGRERPTLRGRHQPLGMSIAVPARRALQVPWMDDVPDATPRRVMQVVAADLARLKGDPDQLTLTAVGTVPTLGWSNARLVPHVYVQAPPDGIWGFDFVARPPSGPAAQAIGKVSACVTLPAAKVRSGIRIHAADTAFVLRVAEVSQQAQAEGDPFEVEGVRLAHDQLELDVSYGGGCREHRFRLLWTGAMTRSIPPQASFRLLHDAAGDACKAIVRETLHFDLVDLPAFVMHLATPFGFQQTMHYRLQE
ncbi:MAG TPA: hypothetical protein VNM90_18175, partial [Haliangium sp.]|nr:hypothetical protein [Haliangium sp.]